MGQQFVFPVRFARRMPDPVFHDSHGINRHIFYVRVCDVPGNPDMPLDPNARIPNINKRVYRDIEAHLLEREGTPGTFHLKHKGITLVADSVEALEEDLYSVTIEEGQGILDGGHTYTLITKERGEVELPSQQYVKFEILTGIPTEWIAEIAGGLNTAVQVQPMSLDNLGHKFDWIKDELRGQAYHNNIAWKENEAGEFDARDLVSLLTLFNVFEFPNDGESQPVVAYEKKSAALKAFEDKPEQYGNLRPILKDILTLHDTIRRDSRTFWNDAGGKFGALSFVEQKKRGQFLFPFTGLSAQYRLMNGALYPMLGAFRWMVEIDSKSGKVRWRGGFKEVLRRWEDSAAELMRMTAQANAELGRNPNAIGKSRNHWANLHARVAMRDLMSRGAATK